MCAVQRHFVLRKGYCRIAEYEATRWSEPLLNREGMQHLIATGSACLAALTPRGCARACDICVIGSQPDFAIGQSGHEAAVLAHLRDRTQHLAAIFVEQNAIAAL